MAANVKQVIGLPSGDVIITYTDGSTQKKKATAATEEIQVAKNGGVYVVGNQNPTGSAGATAAFGTTAQTGASTNVSGTPMVTAENYAAYYQQALSDKPEGYAKVRNAMLKAGIITKGTRSLQSVQNAWATVLQGAMASGKDPFAYLQGGSFGQDVATTTTPEPYTQTVIWDPTKAASVITQQYRDLLHREPTAEELAKDTAALTAEQKKTASASKTTYKKSGGVTQATTTGGLDESQWLANRLQGTEEYKKIQTDLNSAAMQQLKGIAADNGVSLTDTQMVDWSKRLAGGESPEVFKTAIRGIAKLGQPDSVKTLLDQGVDLATVYDPYKRVMAKVLEVNPETITLDDPTLRAAIRPEGEMSIYDYQRSLRKDPRWQYTDNARSEASDIATTVLKDFGFQG